MKKTSFSSVLAANPILSIDDVGEVAAQTWDQLDAYICKRQHLPVDFITTATAIKDVYDISKNPVLTQLATELSNEFGISIYGPEINKCTTFLDLSTLIAQKRLAQK